MVTRLLHNFITKAPYRKLILMYIPTLVRAHENIYPQRLLLCLYSLCSVIAIFSFFSQTTTPVAKKKPGRPKVCTCKYLFMLFPVQE